LEEAGKPRPSSRHQAAHIVPTNAFSNRSAEVRESVKTAQDKFDRFLGAEERDAAINGFWATAGSGHKGTHKDKFLLALGDELEKANSPTGVRNALARLRKQIDAGDFLK
jgi:hypothetical protein